MVKANISWDYCVITFIPVWGVKGKKHCLHGVVKVVDLTRSLSRRWIVQTGIVHVTNHTLKPGQQSSWWHGFIWVMTCKNKRWTLLPASLMDELLVKHWHLSDNLSFFILAQKPSEYFSLFLLKPRLWLPIFSEEEGFHKNILVYAWCWFLPHQ